MKNNITKEAVKSMQDIRKTIPLGKANMRKFWGDSSCRKSNTLNAELCIQQDGCGNIRPVISVTILDEDGSPLLTTFDLKELKDVPELQALPLFSYLLEIQDTYKGTISIGTQEQTAVIRKGFVNGRYSSLSYKDCMPAHEDYLRENSVFEVTLEDGSTYAYGTGICDGKPVSAYHLAIIKTLMGWT